MCSICVYWPTTGVSAAREKVFFSVGQPSEEQQPIGQAREWSVLDYDSYHSLMIDREWWECVSDTWEQLPLLADLKSAIRTAKLGSSIHTFFVD